MHKNSISDSISYKEDATTTAIKVTIIGIIIIIIGIVIIIIGIVIIIIGIINIIVVDIQRRCYNYSYNRLILVLL